MSDQEHESRVLSFIAGLTLGAAIGAGVALLTAPAKGRKTRKRLVKAANSAKSSATDQLEDFADEVKGRVDGALKVARGRIGG